MGFLIFFSKNFVATLIHIWKALRKRTALFAKDYLFDSIVLKSHPKVSNYTSPGSSPVERTLSHPDSACELPPLSLSLYKENKNPPWGILFFARLQEYKFRNTEPKKLIILDSEVNKTTEYHCSSQCGHTELFSTWNTESNSTCSMNKFSPFKLLLQK